MRWEGQEEAEEEKGWQEVAEKEKGGRNEALEDK